MDHRVFSDQYYDESEEDQDGLANYIEDPDDGLWIVSNI